MVPSQGGRATEAVNTVEPRRPSQDLVRDRRPPTSPIETKGAIAAGPPLRNMPHIRVGQPVPLPCAIGALVAPEERVDATVLVARSAGRQGARLGRVLAKTAVAAPIPVVIRRRIGVARPAPVDDLRPIGSASTSPTRPSDVPCAVPGSKGVAAGVAPASPVVPTDVVAGAEVGIRAALKVTPQT